MNDAQEVLGQVADKVNTKAGTVAEHILRDFKERVDLSSEQKRDLKAAIDQAAGSVNLDGTVPPITVLAIMAIVGWLNALTK